MWPVHYVHVHVALARDELQAPDRTGGAGPMSEEARRRWVGAGVRHLEAAVAADADAAAVSVVGEAREVALEHPGGAGGLDALGQALLGRSGASDETGHGRRVRR